MPRIVKLSIAWSAAIILSVFALTAAGRYGLLPEELANNLAAGTVLALSFLATTLLVRQKKDEEE